MTEQFTTLLEDLSAGVFAQKIQTMLAETALGVVSFGRKGKVVIEFDMKRIGESNQVTCAHTVRFDRPTSKGRATEANTDMTPLHVGVGGKLSLFPETQTRLFGEHGEPEGMRRSPTTEPRE